MDAAERTRLRIYQAFLNGPLVVEAVLYRCLWLPGPAAPTHNDNHPTRPTDNPPPGAA